MGTDVAGKRGRGGVRTVAVVIAASLMCGVLARAATPLAAYAAKLKQQLKSVMKTEGKLLDAERQIAMTQMEPFMQALKTTVLPPNQAILGIWPLLEYQRTVGARTDEGLTAIASTMRQAGIEFHAEQPNATALPTGFTIGDGGCGDAAESAFLRRVDASYGAIRKQIAKCAKTLRAKSNVALNVMIRTPTPVEFNGFSDTSFYGSYDSFSLDLLAAASHLGFANDGILIVAGRAETGAGSVEVVANGPDYKSTTTPVDADGRWVVVFDNGGLGMTEGTYSVRARLASGGAWSNWHVGIQ